MLCAGCVASGPTAGWRAPAQPPAAHAEAPFYPQRTYQCGPAALASVLGASGVETAPDALVPQVYTPLRRGSLQADMLSAMRRAGRVPYPVSNAAALMAEVAAGRPVLVLQNLAFAWVPVWHYAVAVGYDQAEGTVTLHTGTRRARSQSAEVFLRTWARAEQWGLVALPPSELPVTLGLDGVLREVVALDRPGQEATAEAAYRAVVGRWPQSALGWLGLGSLLGRRGALDEAASALAAAVDADPALGPAWNNLAHVLAMRGDLAAARAAIERAMAEPGRFEPVYRRTLADIEALERAPTPRIAR